MDILLKYFPDLTDKQIDQFQLMGELYADWNEKINVISRKDMDHFYERHVLHSLAIARYVKFAPGTRIMDIGTGGGFPGVPLAVYFPDCEFLMVDSIEKKIRVVSDVITELGLHNAEAHRGRTEEVKRKFHFITCRAVARFEKLLMWTRKSYLNTHKNALPNGMIALKGGDLKEELKEVRAFHEVENLSDYYEEEFFETKKLVYVQG